VSGFWTAMIAEQVPLGPVHGRAVATKHGNGSTFCAGRAQWAYGAVVPPVPRPEGPPPVPMPPSPIFDSQPIDAMYETEASPPSSFRSRRIGDAVDKRPLEPVGATNGTGDMRGIVATPRCLSENRDGQLDRVSRDKKTCVPTTSIEIRSAPEPSRSARGPTYRFVHLTWGWEGRCIHQVKHRGSRRTSSTERGRVHDA
jgi:hypothetical protein